MGVTEVLYKNDDLGVVVDQHFFECNGKSYAIKDISTVALSSEPGHGMQIFVGVLYLAISLIVCTLLSMILLGWLSVYASLFVGCVAAVVSATWAHRNVFRSRWLELQMQGDTIQEFKVNIDHINELRLVRDAIKKAITLS